MGSNQRIRVAVPSVLPGGMEAVRSAHFGQCECFTLVDLEAGQVVGVNVMENAPHGRGACLAPVNLLADQRTDAIVVDGIGMRPLMGLRDAGIGVYGGFGDRVGPVVEAFARGRLDPISDENVCGGH